MERIENYWRYLQAHRWQLVALALSMLIVVIVHMVWIAPIRNEIQTVKDQLGREQKLVEKYEVKLASAKDLIRELEKEEKQFKEIQKRLVQGKDPYQLAATLGDLAASKDDPELTIKSYQVLKTIEFGLYREVRLKYNLSTTIAGFYRFLDRLQHSKEAISFQEVTVQRRRLRKGPDLLVTVVVAALMEKPEQAKGM